jgi:ribosomal protein S18 acetylase RimI-like enzyme
MASASTPPLHIRQAHFADAEQCGRVCYAAFAAIADQHGFPHDFPSVDAATAACASILNNPLFFGVVAAQAGRVIGSNFLDERSSIYSVGPITVEPRHQNNHVGRKLMRAVLARAEQQRVPNVRLVQAGYNTRSLSLYSKLGFTVRESLATLAGEPLHLKVDGRVVRPAVETDVATGNSLCVSVHGHARGGELMESVAQGAANVVEYQGRITGYSTGIGFFSHAVAETNDDLSALIGAAHRIDGPGLLLPMRNTELLRRCLDRGLRVVSTMNLMTVGQYQDPRAPYLASIGY